MKIKTTMRYHLTISQNESESEVTQLWPTLCDPMDSSLSGSSVYRIFQARVLEWAAISFSRASFQGMELGSPALQTDTLLSEPPGKPGHHQNAYKH